MKKQIALWMALLLAMASGFAPDATPTIALMPAAALAADGPTDTVDPEIIRAISYRFVPKALQRNYDQQITYWEMCEMLTNLIALNHKEALPNWEESAKLALNAERGMRRSDGALALFYAAEAMGILEFEPDSISWRYFRCIYETIYANMMETNRPDGLAEIDGEFQEVRESELTWDWDLFPQWETVRDECLQQGHIIDVNAAVLYSLGKSSLVSTQSLYDFDSERVSAHYDHELTRGDAIRAVLRLGESEISVLGLSDADMRKTRTLTAEDEAFLTKADARRQVILNSETDINYTGTAYYVANYGSDKNDGKSPEKPWATLDRVNKAKAQKTLKPNDAVFFNRGDLWRGYIDCARGVTYSAYGMGEKPKIYGSVESGADPSKWELWHDENGVKIWKFYRDITEVGNIVFDDGDSYATRMYAYYNGESWVVSGNDQRTFDVIQELKHDLTFYSTFELSSKQFNNHLAKNGGNPFTDLMDTTGQLYLRCDAGNPGELYREVEFHTFPKGRKGYVGLVDPVGDNIIDNLCIKYSLRNGIAIYGDTHDNLSNTNNIIQNCEIAWCGGDQHDLNRVEGDVMVCGEGIVFKTGNNVFRNNHIHQVACAGIVSEFVSDDYIPGNTMCENSVIEGNLFEKCPDTLWFWDNYYHGDDIVFWKDTTIADNYVMYMGYGWATNPKFTYPSNIVNTFHPSGNDGHSIAVNVSPNGIQNMLVKDNVFYVSNGWITQISYHRADSYDIVFSGNTYVQNERGLLLADKQFVFNFDSNQALRDIERFLGDTTAIVFGLQ